MIARMDGLRWVAVLAAVVFLTGCNSLQAENDKLRRENEELRQKESGYQQNLDAAMNQRRILEDENKRLAAELAAKASSQAATAATPVTNKFEGIEGVETSQDANRVTVGIAGDILFDSGKVELKSTAKKTLNEIATVIQREYSGKMVGIRGYTDTDPIRRSKWQDNLDLSQQRAAAVHRELQKMGVAPGQLYAAGFGEWHPRDSKARSRRVEIVVELN